MVYGDGVPINKIASFFAYLMVLNLKCEKSHHWKIFVKIDWWFEALNLNQDVIIVTKDMEIGNLNNWNYFISKLGTKYKSLSNNESWASN